MDKNNKRQMMRLAVRCCALTVAVFLVLPILPWPWTSLVLPSLSVYVLICSAVAARAVGIATFIGLPVLLIVLIRRRWFCRYGCPVGLLAEYAGRLRRTGTSAIGRSAAGKLPHIGRWTALLTLGGALFGYPLFLWLDPLAIFHGVFTLCHDPASLAGQVSAAVLAAILVLSLLLPGIWCTRLCPLGATQELLVLPQRLFRWKASSTEPPSDDGKWRLPRRSVLSGALGALCLGIGARWGNAASQRSSGDPHKMLRPPGAADESRFSGLCIRCGNCIRACPTKIIHADLGSDGVAGFLAPAVSFAKDYCREDCHLCTLDCPSGAIARLSLEEKQKTSMGVAKLEVSLCLLYDDRECDICARQCPYEAITIVWSQEEYIALPHVDRSQCPGCGACEVICPGTNEWERENSDKPIPLRKAIAVVPRSSPST